MNTPPASPFLLIFREPSGDVYGSLSPEERQRLLEQWNAWYDGLAEQGKVQHGQPLEPGGCVVRQQRVTDGPFVEAKEAIGGYFLLTVTDIEEAKEIARRCPSLHLGMSVEVRPIAGACPGLGVKGRPIRETAAI